MNPRRDWNQFWFGAFSPVPLGLFRIAFGAVVAVYGLLLFQDRFIWFSEHGVYNTQIIDRFNAMSGGFRPFQLLHGPVPDGWITLFLCLFISSALLLMIGLWTRLFAVLVWIGLNSIHNRNPIIDNSGDLMMAVMSFYLVFAPAGAACSIDRLLAMWRGKAIEVPHSIAAWTVRLMQLQVSIVYFCACTSKLNGSEWNDGTAVYYATHLTELTRFPLPPALPSTMWLFNVLTFLALGTEFSLATFVWVRQLRLYVLTAGIMMHLGIEYSLNIPLFSALMMSSYLVFLRPSDMDRFLDMVRVYTHRSRLQLVFDGECDFCRSVLMITRALDPFRLVTYLNGRDEFERSQAAGVTAEDSQRAAVAVDTAGRAFHGYYAFRAMAWRLPALWAFAPLMYIPGVPQVGVRVYQWVTNNRDRLPVAAKYRNDVVPASNNI